MFYYKPVLPLVRNGRYICQVNYSETNNIDVKTCLIICDGHHEFLRTKRRWVIFKKMKTLCDIEGEISNWTNGHNFGRKIMSI